MEYEMHESAYDNINKYTTKYLSNLFDKDGVHRIPVDCWRFLPDGYKALCKWEPRATLIDSFIDTRPHRDCTGAFKIKK